MNRLAVLNAVRKHIPCLAPLCASQFVRDGTVAVIQERDGNGKKSELHCSVAKGVWQGNTLGSATFCLTFWNKMQELTERTNGVRRVMGFVSYADDFGVISDDDEADRLWDDTHDALREIGFEIGQSKSCCIHETGKRRNGTTEPIFNEKSAIPGTEATEWNSTATEWTTHALPKRDWRTRTNSLAMSRRSHSHTLTQARRQPSGL